MKKLITICALVASPTFAYAQDTALATPTFVTELMSKVPVDVIAWVIAVFGLLTSLASFLDFLNKKLNKEGQSGFLNKVSHGLSIFLKYVGKVVDMFTANTRPK